MNDEIKEILREMKEMCEIWVKVDGNMKSYNQDQIHCIYDYITNLQKEIAELKAKLEMYENGVYYSSENDKLQEKIDKTLEYLDFMIKHYKEQLDTPIDDTYFINDDLRRAYILSIKAYLQVLLELLKGSEKDE